MATELQNKLYRENDRFNYLSELMIEVVYVRLFDTMTKLGMEEVRFAEINTWKQFCITLDGKLQFFTLTSDGKKENLYELNFYNEKKCPFFYKDGNKSIKAFESPISNYINYCEAVINKIEELEIQLNNVESLISKIHNIGISIERNVFIEKINYEKKQ